MMPESVHHKAKGVSDRLALGFTKVLRFCADTFFARRYGRRAVVLETVAAVPGWSARRSPTCDASGTCPTTAVGSAH